ncbi:MAG: carboxylating nicotinate-nucleotide diphosphorylase [Deltaproteobacteria bacterium]|nr:carboxylating nicotinate-nucleotide diphosphorylase [Deltaproteobacteria bacterium]
MLDSPLVKKIIRLAIEEDLSQGDVTSELSIPVAHKSLGRFVAKENLIVCGVPLLQLIASEIGGNLKVVQVIEEGKQARRGTVIAEVSGRTVALLAFERTALNFLQRMCGIATFTRNAVKKAGSITLLDTRKTMPGHRVLDKYSVRVGGARNHRFSLGDLILVKNNHVDAGKGGLPGVLERIIRLKPPYMAVEVEVRNRKELEQSLSFKPEIVMLDNMNNREVAAAISLAQKLSPSTMIEVSGGVSIERLPALSKLGVQLVSMGALTNKAQAVDISLRITVK